MNALQVRFNKISLADFRGKSRNKHWKPEVTPPRRRGGFNKGIGADNLTICNEVTHLRVMTIMVV